MICSPIFVVVADNSTITLTLIDRIAGVIDEFRRTIATLVNRVGPLTLTVDSYPTSESPFDSRSHVIAQFFRSLQRSLDPDNLLCLAKTPNLFQIS
jgi:hypothetical protein